MSYCVNCGVELDRSEQRCPLCGVEAVNPAEPFDRTAPRPYPARIERINVRVNRRYTALFISLLLLIPVFVTVFSDALTSGGISWSAYVVGGALVLFTWLLLPMLLQRPNPYLCVLCDGLAALLFLLLIELITKKSWFLRLGLPLALLATGYALLITFLCDEKRTMELFLRVAAALTGAGFAVVGVECAVRLYREAFTWPHWSLYALFPCLVLSAVLLVLNRRERFKSELKRRFYI